MSLWKWRRRRDQGITAADIDAADEAINREVALYDEAINRAIAFHIEQLPIYAQTVLVMFITNNNLPHMLSEINTVLAVHCRDFHNEVMALYDGGWLATAGNGPSNTYRIKPNLYEAVCDWYRRHIGQ